MNAERDTKDGPFCWQSKAALRRIRDSLGDDLSAACRTRSVYLALCEIASDKGAAQFIVPKGLLAFRAGLSPRTVQRAFPALERAGVLTVERNATGLKASSRYTLLAVSAPTGHNVSTIGHGVSTIGHGGGSGLSPLYEERKEPKEPILAPNGASELFGIPAQPIAPVSKVGRRNALLEALVAFDGSNPADATASAWGAAAKALAEIEDVSPEVTLAEITRRAANYRTHFPDAATSGPKALSKHWACCQNARATATATNGRPEATVNRLNLKAP